MFEVVYSTYKGKGCPGEEANLRSRNENNPYLAKHTAVTVYDVKMDKNGYPYFLIYADKRWQYVLAKYCVPI